MILKPEKPPSGVVLVFVNLFSFFLSFFHFFTSKICSLVFDLSLRDCLNDYSQWCRDIYCDSSFINLRDRNSNLPPLPLAPLPALLPQPCSHFFTLESLITLLPPLAPPVPLKTSNNNKIATLFPPLFLFYLFTLFFFILFFFWEIIHTKKRAHSFVWALSDRDACFNSVSTRSIQQTNTGPLSRHGCTYARISRPIDDAVIVRQKLLSAIAATCSTKQR